MSSPLVFLVNTTSRESNNSPVPANSASGMEAGPPMQDPALADELGQDRRTHMYSYRFVGARAVEGRRKCDVLPVRASNVPSGQE